MSTFSSTSTQLMIRPAYGDDYSALARLAALDSADQVPPRPLLIAEVDGVLRAALSLADGSSIADPFYPSVRLIELLHTHAADERPRSGLGSAGRGNAGRAWLPSPRVRRRRRRSGVGLTV